MEPRLPLQFEIHPSSGVPIYRQLMDQMRTLIASGRIASGELVPSVRQMAEELQVNLMTVSKAYARLEADGILERDRGVGMRVKPHQSAGTRVERLHQLRPLADQLATLAWQLKLTDDQVLQLVKSSLTELSKLNK
jgi:GntR family transcriptional regulator